MSRRIAFAAAVLLGAQASGAQALGAQVQAKQVELGAHAGLQLFSRGTALENSPFVGLAATWQLPWNPLSSLITGSSFGVGVLFDISRPVTRGDQFDAITIDAGDTTFLYTVAQRDAHAGRHRGGGRRATGPHARVRFCRRGRLLDRP